MSSELLRATLTAAAADWRREAEGSRHSQAVYEQQAIESQRIADEHRLDAERAEANVAGLEALLRAKGFDL